jgi:hypothetical protein
MRFGWMIGGLVGLTVLGVACKANEEEVEGGAAAASGTETPEAMTVGNLTLTKKVISTKVKAKQADPDEFGTDFDSCSVDANFWEIKGTAHDEEINKILRGEFVVPTAASCETPEEFGQEARLIGVDPDQGLMAITEFESFFAGGAHPSHGTEFKMIDLRSGQLLSLADYVKADGAPKLNDLVKAEIATKKIKTLVGAPAHDRGGRVKKFEFKLLPEEDQEMMKGFSDGYFTTVTEEGQLAPANLAAIHDFTIAGTGLRIDLTNQLPHALGGIDAAFKVKWRDLEAAGILRTDTDLVERTKKARPKQLHSSGLSAATAQ